MSVDRKQFSARFSQGVTLIEMMIGLIIISVGMTVAVPSFQGMIARNSIATQVNEMLLAINLARSEASRTGSGVNIQAAAAATTDEFGGGWCVVPSTQVNCAANVIRNFPALTNGATLNLIDDGGATGLQFSALGGIVGDVSLILDFCITGQSGRRIFISPIGRSSSHNINDPIVARRPAC